MSLDLATLRSEFPILSTSNYMISNSLGAMPRGVEASLQEYATAWATRGVRAWAERWWISNVQSRSGKRPADEIGRHCGIRSNPVGAAALPV